MPLNHRLEVTIGEFERHLLAVDYRVLPLGVVFALGWVTVTADGAPVGRCFVMTLGQVISIDCTVGREERHAVRVDVKLPLTWMGYPDAEVFVDGNRGMRF